MSYYKILDLDGCISDDAWRIEHISLTDPDPFRRYHAYHQRAAWDVVRNHDLFSDPSAAYLILTARPVFYRGMTQEWLRRAGIPVHALLMRNNDDHRPSPELKRAQLAWLPEYGVSLAEIVAAYDDREDVVSVYREAGLMAHRRAIHNHGERL